jgi:outer membrane protein assembly factor BamB
MKPLREGATRWWRVMLAVTSAAALSACGIGNWFGGPDKQPLPGERISVLLLDQKIEPDPKVAGLPVTLPPITVNQAWPQAGGNPDHVMGNLSLPPTLREAWRTSIGEGSSDSRQLLARPIIADDKIYVMDANSNVSALEVKTGRSLWRVSVAPSQDHGDAIGGGISFAAGRLYVTTGYGEAIALNPRDGSFVWRQRLAGPLRGAPTIVGDRVFMITVDNQLVALSATDGSTLWTHTGILESASLLGGASPAADNDIVVAPYSSGELFALRLANGGVAWSDNLAAARRMGELTGLADIRGMPVIDRGLVFAISHSGRMAAIDQRTGARAWEQEIGGVDMPWVAGDFIFVLTNDGQVLALTRAEGRTRWVAPQAQYVDPDKRTKPIVWTGPVLGGGRLWLGNSLGQLVELSTDTGKELSRRDAGDTIALAPVIADNTLFVLTDDAYLVAYR